jgi:hypothetical protein
LGLVGIKDVVGIDDVDDSPWWGSIILVESVLGAPLPVPDPVSEGRRLSTSTFSRVLELRLFRSINTPTTAIMAIPAARPPTTAPITTPELLLLDMLAGNTGADMLKEIRGVVVGGVVGFKVALLEGASVGSSFVIVGKGVAGIATGWDVVGAEGLRGTATWSKQYPSEPVRQYSFVDTPTDGMTCDCEDPVVNNAASLQASLTPSIPYSSTIFWKSSLDSAHSKSKSE